MKHVEMVVPCYNEQECVLPLYEEIYNVFKEMEDFSFSILFVNDGSSDGTLEEIKALVNKKGNRKVKYISFARNFGKEAAIYAGLSKCKGDYIVLMDGDLQHPPKVIPEMILKMEKGHDCCGARRVSRKGEPIFRSLFSKIFYKIINSITSMRLVPGGSDFRIMTKQMVEAVVSLSERERFTKGIMSWVGFDTVWIEYENVERVAGKSKWTFLGLIKYAWSGFISFATTPLRTTIYMGLLIVLVDFIYMFTVFFGAINGTGERTGYATIVILMLFLGGVIITILGIIGEYLSRIYMELKRRPIYIQKETNIED